MVQLKGECSMDQKKIFLVTFYDEQGIRVGMQIEYDLEGAMKRTEGSIFKCKVWECTEIIKGQS
jgi:hypothetical protein